MITTRRFGNTDLQVPVLGLGTGSLGDPKLDEDFVGSFLNQAVEMGFTLIDTARGYGEAEYRIAKHLGWRRQQFLLCTKVGYGVDWVEDWTYDCVRYGIDRALWQLKTDYLDIVHLHSCDLEILQRGEVIQALIEAKQSGRVRYIGYSGENEALAFAAESGVFDSLMCSVNLYDQASSQTILPANKHCGVIAKRAIANAPWRFSQQPIGDYAEEYWLRAQVMELGSILDLGGMPWAEVAIRFSAFNDAVDCAIVGSNNLHHLFQAKKWIEQGPLPAHLVQQIKARFNQCNQAWKGLI